EPSRPAGKPGKSHHSASPRTEVQRDCCHSPDCGRRRPAARERPDANGGTVLERVTISLEESLLAEFDRYIAGKGYQNRSEAIRDLVRDRLEAESGEDPTGTSVGCVSYVYNHHQRDLAQRLTNAQHGHHDIVLSSLHVHLDHENCLEVTLLRGPTGELRAFAESLMAE